MTSCCAQGNSIGRGERVSWKNDQNGCSGSGTLACVPACVSEDGVAKYLVRVDSDGFKISGKSREAKAAIQYGIEKGSGPYQWATSITTPDGRSVGNTYSQGKTTMNSDNRTADVLGFLRSSELSEDDKLLLELGLEDPTGVPTAKGIQIAQELVYKDKRDAIIKIAQDLKAEQDKEKEASK